LVWQLLKGEDETYFFGLILLILPVWEDHDMWIRETTVFFNGILKIYIES
jgi:hypothetical protein